MLACCVYLTQAEGKVDNYTELATIGPYPVKIAPEESVEYTNVIPSNVRMPHKHMSAHAHTCTYTHTHKHTHIHIHTHTNTHTHHGSPV